MKALVVPTSLNDKLYAVSFNHSNELSTTHKEIGCNSLDFVVLGKYGDYSIYASVDDCGAINGNKINERFSMSYREYKFVYPLYGKVVITMIDNFTGDTVDLSMRLVKDTLINKLGFNKSDFTGIE